MTWQLPHTCIQNSFEDHYFELNLVLTIHSWVILVQIMVLVSQKIYFYFYIKLRNSVIVSKVKLHQK